MMESAQLRRWTNEVDLIRRRIRRVSKRQENAAAADVLAECLAACERLLQDLVLGEDEVVRLRRVAAEERRNWERLFETTPFACVLTDTQSMVLGANRSASLLFNVSGARLTGQLLLHFVSDRQRVYEALNTHIAGDRPLRMPLRLRPREKPVTDVDAIVVSDVSSHSAERLWFLVPPSEANRLQAMTAPIEQRPEYETDARLGD